LQPNALIANGSALIFDFCFLLLDFQHQLNHRGLQWDQALFAGSDRRGFVLHSLIVRGLYWRFTMIASLSQGLIVRAPYFLSLDKKVQQCLQKGGSTRLMTAICGLNWTSYPGQKINHTTINRWAPLWSTNQRWDGKAALFVATKNRGKIDALGVGKAWPIGVVRAWVGQKRLKRYILIRFSNRS
jgi:hypothetical protein